MFLNEKNLPIVRTENEIQHDNLVNFIAALRSGKFKQTRTLIYDNGAYCAMGVAYRSLGLTRKEAEVSFNYLGKIHYDGVLKDEVIKSLGLNNDQTIEIMNLNDSDNSSFEVIANHIEKEYLPILQKKLGM